MRVRTTLISAAVAAAGALATVGTAAAAPTKLGTETFTITQDANGNPTSPLVASGVINDQGTDIVVDSTTDIFDFGANGSIVAHHSPVRQVQHFSEKKCSGTFKEAGVYTLDHGTGEWANFIGSGTYKVVGHITDACTGPGTGTVTITASGPLSIPNND